jgi:MscS family membrane protein
MKSIMSATQVERMRVVRLAALVAIGLLLVRPALGQPPSAPAPQPAVPPPADTDPLGRSTPYGTVEGFIRAAQAGDYARASEYLETRRRGTSAEELAQQLRIVLDRGLRVDLDSLSRKPEGDTQDNLDLSHDRVGTVNTGSGALEILLVRVERQEQQPIWLFSSATLEHVPAAAGEMYTPILETLETYLPHVLVDVKIFSLSIYRWILMLLALALALALGAALARLLAPLLRPALRRLTGEEVDRRLVSLRAPLRLILIAVVIRFFTTISASLVIRQFWTRVAVAVAIIGLAWLVMQLVDIVWELGVRHLYRRRNQAKVAMWTLVRRLAKASVVIVTGLALLGRAGADLTAILTGLGIGGLGLAFAAQKTLENLFGGVMIISDEPIRVGDFCRVGDQMGTVEDIGVRSTRIRTLGRTVVSVPNGQLAVMNIENFSLRDKFWLRHQIGLRYETTADQLRYVLAGIRTMLLSHPKVEQEGARIRFVGFGASSLDLEMFAYVRATEMPEFLAIQEDLLLRIMDIVAEGGTGIAFPSQTTYLARDKPLDAQKTEEAASRVREWRERGELPFPDFDRAQVGQLSGRIEYPPPGSALRNDGDGPRASG